MTFKLQTCDDKKSEQTVHVNRMKQFIDPEERRYHDEEKTVSNIENDNKIRKIVDTMRSRNES